MIIRAKAPLRLGLAGGGTDVSPYSDEFGGFVLNATIDMYAYCIIEKRYDEKVNFAALDRNESFEHAAASKFELDGTLELHKAVYNRIVADYNQGKPLSIDIMTYSDAPAGSGLGSSSTIVVAMIKAYQELLNLPLGEYDIAQLAYVIERIDAGLTGGKQDQYAAAFGGFNFMEFSGDNHVLVNPLRIKASFINELESSMILFYTGTSRESAAIIDEQIKNTQERVTSSLEAMHELKKDAAVMKEALLKGNIPLFSEYLGRSWDAKKRMARSISNSFIDEIYIEARNSGACAGKISGAGGGGFMMLMCNPKNKIKVRKSLERFGGNVINFHFVQNGCESWVSNW